MGGKKNGTATTTAEVTTNATVLPVWLKVSLTRSLPRSSLTLIAARAIGLMPMIDSGKKDPKIIAVAIGDPEFNSYKEAREMPPHRLVMLRRFFQDYKQLEGKSVEVDEIEPAAAAYPIIEDALHRYSEQRRRGFKAA